MLAAYRTRDGGQDGIVHVPGRKLIATEADDRRVYLRADTGAPIVLRHDEIKGVILEPEVESNRSSYFDEQGFPAWSDVVPLDEEDWING